MPKYVDGFVLPVSKKKLPAYRKLAQQAAKVWMAHGALSYMECVGDDLNIGGMLSFNTLAKTKPSETVMFSFITYQSKKHRDRVNAKAMKDPVLGAFCADPKKMPFDCSRMAYGGFKALVES